MAQVVTAAEPRLGARILSVAECADAVTAALNAASFSKPFLAVREWLPRFDLADLGDRVKVIVTAGDGYLTTRVGRDAWQREPQVRIVVCARVGDEPYDAEVDGLMGFVEEVRDMLAHVALPETETWKGQRRAPLRAVSIENEPVVSTETLETMRQFTSVLTVTFRVID
jgi:hypothetical protein